MPGFSFSAVIRDFFSEDQISAITAATIGIAGAGGLGSNCAVNLVRCGFAKFVIADGDVVEVSNLNRQAFVPAHIGLPKADCLREIMRNINPACSITAHMLKVEESNVHGLFGACDVVVEAFDRPECKAMIVNAFIGSGKLVVSASGVGGFGNSDRIMTRKVRDDFYLIGDGVSGVNNTVRPLSPCVSIAAAKEADAVLEWVLTRNGKK